jgi:hypothetical protein
LHGSRGSTAGFFRASFAFEEFINPHHERSAGTTRHCGGMTLAGVRIGRPV